VTGPPLLLHRAENGVLKPRVSFSMHPRWAHGDGLRPFLDPLHQAGLRALEFELDANDGMWPLFEPLLQDSKSLGYELCFHAPYRPPHSIAGFSGRARGRIQSEQSPMFELAARYGPAHLVVHGARSEAGPKRRLLEDTVSFLEWVLSAYPNLSLGIENSCPQAGVHKIGEENSDLTRVLEQLVHPRLGICWDIGHQVKAGRLELPPMGWLGQVRHVHIHDLDTTGQDHVPFLFGRVDPEYWLPPLARARFGGIVTVELNGQRCSFLWPDRIVPALIASVELVAHALKGDDRT